MVTLFSNKIYDRPFDRLRDRMYFQRFQHYHYLRLKHRTMPIPFHYNREDASLLANCTLCPRNCGLNRFEGRTGVCGMDAGMNIASICVHRGEEPVISGKDGICNVFFAGCNLSCIYCQNLEISNRKTSLRNEAGTLADAVDKISAILDRGINALGFVSPSHMVPQMKAIIREINNRGYKPVIVYNTNAYDKPEIIESLDELVDVFLPDFKYVSRETARKYSGAKDYPEVALAALKKMYYLRGSKLLLDDNGRAERGMLIRHLVLPGHVNESIELLRTLADELSTGVHISLMSQYYPTANVKQHPVLHRSLYYEEYKKVAEAMEGLGFRNGWIQEMESSMNYRPDFRKSHPFE